MKTENAIRFAQFVQGLSSEFLDMIDALDPRALLLCAYWLGCLCSVNLWWARNRSKNDCRTICAYLEKWHPELIPYLEFPAQQSGFHLDTSTYVPP